MSIDYIPSLFMSVVLSALLAALPVKAQEQADVSAESVDKRLDEQSYQRAIAAIESRGGRLRCRTIRVLAWPWPGSAARRPA